MAEAIRKIPTRMGMIDLRVVPFGHSVFKDAMPSSDDEHSRVNACHSHAIVGKDAHAQTDSHHVFVYLAPTFDRVAQCKLLGV